MSLQVQKRSSSGKKMRANKIILNYFLAAILMTIAVSACKKTHDYVLVTSTDDTATQSIIAADELELNRELDQGVNDALAASAISTLAGGDSAATHNLFAIAHAVIDTSGISTNNPTGLIKITYYGKNEDGTQARTGEIDIQHAVMSGQVVPWKTPGAGATITFKQYEIVYLNFVNRSLWLNGTCTVTNVTGGLLKNIANPLLVPGDSLVDRVKAHVTFTHNDNVSVIKTNTWDFNRLRIFNTVDTTIMLSVKGDTSVHNIANTASWGMTTSGQDFTTGITTPTVQKILKSGFVYNPLKGVKVIHDIAEPMTVTYGVDQQGNPVSNGAPYGYKITWFSIEPRQTVIGY